MNGTLDLWTRLINGEDVEEFRIYDVSDSVLYGSKNRRELPEPLATIARSSGLEPIIYQSVFWFCIVFIPVYPRGTYLIIPHAVREEDDADRYRGIRIAWDWRQIVLHWLVGIVCLAAIVTIFVTLASYRLNSLRPQ